MPKIVVAGYPKSGNTWCCRLVAEVLNSPFAYFLEDKKYMSVESEGMERTGDWVVVKSHHTVNEIKKMTAPEDRIIVMIRNPSDVYSSSLRFFRADKVNLSQRCERLPSIVGRAYSFLRQNIFRFLDRMSPDTSFKFKISYSILMGSNITSRWMKPSWSAYYREAQASNALMIRYEDLLNDPEQQLSRILEHLQCTIDTKFIRNAIYLQSFNVRKKAFLRQNEKEKAALLKVAQSSYGRELNRFERGLLNLAKPELYYDQKTSKSPE
jgi:LPS sulfotransferase NodH